MSLATIHNYQTQHNLSKISATQNCHFKGHVSEFVHRSDSWSRRLMFGALETIETILFMLVVFA